MSVVLIVEDQLPVARLMVRWVEAEGARAVVATSAEQALLVASEQPPAVALCDVNLPGGRDGFWLAEQLRVLHPETAVVMTTGLHHFDAAVAGLRAGVVDYVTKPITRERLQQALERAMADYASRKASMASAAVDDASAVASSTRAALLTVLRAQGGASARHAQHASDVAVRLARTLSMSASDVARVECATLLSHVDRVDVHALGRKIPHVGDASGIALASQERFDGTGFPLGLKGTAIPQAARVVAVANAYDTLVGDSGMLGMKPERAVELLCRDHGGEFDPSVLRALRIIQRELSSIAA